MALLGRISAVLTANTQDFTRQIGTARREIQDFARQARGVQFNLNTRSLDGTLTQLQRFQRTLREIQQLQSRGVDAGLPNANRLRDQFRAFEDVGRPLTAVKNQIEGLSNAVQAELYPSLERAQAGFRNLYTQIEAGTTTYDRSAARIENLQRRITALGRATAAAGDFSNLAKGLNANNTGASFFQPRARESLQRSLELRNQAQNVPARFRGGVFADLSVEAERNADDIERAAARVAAAQLRIAEYGETPSNLARRGRAQQNLDSLTNRQTVINASFQRELTSAQIQQVVSPDAERQVDVLRARFETLANDLRQLGGTRFNGLIAGVGSVVEQLNRGAVSAREAQRAVESLAAASSSVNINRDLARQTESLLYSPDELQRRQIRSNFDSQASRLAPNDPARRGLENDRDIAMTRLRLNNEIIPRTQGLADSARGLENPALEQQANRLLQYNREISAELRRQDQYNQAGNYRAAEQSLQRINALLANQGRLEGQIAADVATANTARRQSELFMQASGGNSEQLSQGARDAASDISVGRQFRGQIANGGARIAIQAEIDRTTASVIRLQRQMADVAASGLGTDAMVRELDRLDNEIRQTTQGLSRFIATRSGGAYSEQQISTAMERARNTAGSITTRGAGAVQLAAQQALFAIDDLISSTGGLEYRLRAVGNNITQLGLLLGQSGVIPGLNATTGLMVGLGVVVGGQVVSALLRYITAAQEASEVSKALGKSVERQAALLNEISSGFASIGENIANVGFSDAAKSAKEFADALEKVVKQQAELRREQLLATDVGAVRRRGLNDRLDARLEGAQDPGVAIAVQRQRAELARLDRGRGGDLAALQPPSGAEVQASLRAAAERLREAQASLTGIRGTNEALASGNMAPGALFGLRVGQPVLAATSQRADQLAQGLPLGESKKDRDAQVAAIDEIIESLKGKATETLFGFRTTAATAASETIRELQQQQLRIIGDSGLVEYFKSASDASKSLAESQSFAAAAVRDGIPAAIALQANLDELAKRIADSQSRIAQANADFAQNKDAGARDRVIERERGIIANSERQRTVANQRARQIEFQRTVDPQVLTSSRLTRANANLSSAGLESGIIARQIRELEARAARAQLDAQSANPFVRMRAAREMDAVNKESAAVEAATKAALRFAEALDRASQEANSNVEAAMQREEESRRNFERPVAGDVPQQRAQAFADRERAQANLGEQKRAQRDVQDASDRARNNIERRAMDQQDPLSSTFRRLKEIDELLASGDPNVNRNEMIADRRRLNDQIDAQVNADPGVVAARDNSNRIEERQRAEARGRDLMMTPAERAGKELADSLNDVNAAFNDQLLPDRAAQARVNSRLVEEAMRQQAPAIFNMADEVQNAVLQGPSRAALQASDVTTTSGASELNRLLRGDDSAKNQNLVELQKQSSALNELVAVARANSNPPGVFD